MKISVIMPVYNVEEYLGKCLDTILNQNFEEYEVIAINDGSTDKSYDILENYKKRYNRLVIVNKKNSGVGDSRNIGVTLAQGEYIYFLDSDDYVDENLLGTVYSIAKSGNYDIVSWGFYFVDEKERIIGTQKLGNTEKKEHLLNDWPVVWNKIFKKEVISKSGIVFPKDLWHQDLATIPFYILSAKKCIYINKELYYYRLMRKGSITSTFGKKSHDIFKILQIIYDRINEFPNYENQLKFLIYYHGRANIRKWRKIGKDNPGLENITRSMNEFLDDLKVNTLKNKFNLYLIIIKKIPSRFKRFMNKN